MNFQGLLTLFVAAACIFAVGAASTSLDAVETDPSDVIDTSQIPTQDNPPTTGDSPEPDPGDEDVSPEESEGTPEEEEAGGDEAEDDDGMSGGFDDVPMMSLWDILSQYLVYAAAVVAAVFAAVVGYIVYKRRFAGGVVSGDGEIVYDVDTSNEVYEAWWEMVETAGVEDPVTMTPQEVAEAAVDEGYDPEAVSEITRLFEETLYGGKEVTREEERRAREAIERIKSKGKTV